MSMFVDPPNLPDWLAAELPFQRRMHVEGRFRVHFIDEGEGPVVLLMHGNPTWSFLWRKIIDPLVKAGFRVIAPDLVGFGLSDKPRRVRDHSLRLHMTRIAELVLALKLDRLTLVGQDWGGPVVAGVASLMPERVAGLVFGNTSVLRPARPFRSTKFHRFAQMPVVSDLIFRGLMFPVPLLGRAQGDKKSIGFKETLAYAHPLQNPIDRAGPVALARMVPNTEDHPTTPVMDQIGAWAEAYQGPISLVWGEKDPVLGRALKRHMKAWPQAEVTRTEAGHFLQEEVPQALVDAIVKTAGQVSVV